MRVQAYTAYSASLTITVATPRSEPAPSVFFFAASIHEDYCAKVDSLLREYRQCAPNDVSWPAAQRIQSYLPTFNSLPIYAIRELKPAGSPRDVDGDWQLEVMRIRYDLMINLLPGAFLTGGEVGSAISRNVQAAVKSLFQANSIPDVFIPGDGNTRLGDRSEVDIICEMGPAITRGPVEIPATSA